MEVLNLTKPPGHPSASHTLGVILYTPGNEFSSVENFASLLTFKYGLIFFFSSFSLKKLFMCFTSYKIISLSSSNWPPGACFYITTVSEMAKRLPWAQSAELGWAGSSHGAKSIGGLGITGLLQRVKFGSSITC